MDNRKNRQAALAPEDLARFFVLRANAGDIEGLVALYESDAVLAGTEGRSQVALNLSVASSLRCSSIGLSLHLGSKGPRYATATWL